MLCLLHPLRKGGAMRWWRDQEQGLENDKSGQAGPCSFAGPDATCAVHCTGAHTPSRPFNMQFMNMQLV